MSSNLKTIIKIEKKFVKKICHDKDCSKCEFRKILSGECALIMLQMIHNRGKENDTKRSNR